MFFISEIWRRIWRNKGRSLLSICIAALLVSFVGIYMGNIKKNEITLQSLSDTIPVMAQITNRNGSRDIGLEINTNTLDKLLSEYIVDAIYTAQAGGNLDPNNRVEPIKMCDTIIVATNNVAGVPLIVGDGITYLEGWDDTYLGSDEALCTVSESYAARHAISIGDTISFPLYVIKYEKDGMTHKFIEVGEPSLMVIGTFRGDNEIEESRRMVVPVKWLRLYAEDNGIPFYYDSARATVKDPLNLNEFKSYMEEMNFGAIDVKASDRRSGDKLIVQDKIFIETASKILNNLKMFRLFQVPFVILIVILIILVSFLILRSYQKDMAIASSLGRQKIISGASYFLENMILYLLGCVIVLPILIHITGIGLGNMLLIYLLFLGCAGIGIWGAILLLLRFDTLALLTKID